MSDQLSHADMEVLAFERTPWKYQARKEEAIRERFGISLTRYYQRLNWILTQPAAETYDPNLVRRIRTLQGLRRHERTGGLV